jgi:hypothetical protein
MMDREDYERQQEELARHAASEGAWYYDPDSPTLWKRFILGPVPLWRRVFWSIFPPSFLTLMQFQQRRRDRICEEATRFIRSPKQSAPAPRVAGYEARAQANELEWLDELVREHEAGTRDNSDYIRRLIRSITEEHEPSTARDAKLANAQRIVDRRA